MANAINTPGANYASVPCSGLPGCQCGNCNQWTYQPTGIGTTVNPYTITYPNVSNTISWGNYRNTKYSVLNLPKKKKMPCAVYVAGKMLTLGLLGTDVEAAFTGNQLVFSPNVLAISGANLTLIIEYADESYHYNLFKGLLSLSYAPGSQTLLDPQLLSIVKKT